MKLVAKRVNKENFAHMGQVIAIPQRSEVKPSLEGDGFWHVGELAFIDTYGPLEFGITTFDVRPKVTSCLEQHAKTPEMLLALDGPFVMPVAPMIEVEGKQEIDLSRLSAIYVEQGQGVIFKDGYWHWAPFPIERSSSVLVGFKPMTWADDIVIKDLPESVEITIE